MEIKAVIEKPCTDEERADFIVEQNHQKGYIIEETDEVIEAWGQTAEELLADRKAAKQAENTEKAKLAVENGHVVFKNAEFETNAQTVGDLTATMLLMQAQQAVILSDSEVSNTDDVAQDSSATPQNDDLISSQNEDSTSPQNADVGELTYLWLSKDDKVVGLTLADFGTLGALIAEYKNTIWQEKYIAYKAAIEQAETVEAVNAIVLDYSDGGEE